VSWKGLADPGLDFVALLVRSRVSQLLAQLLPLPIALPPAAYLSIAFPHTLVSSPRKQTCLCSLVHHGLDLNARLYLLLALRSNGWTKNVRVPRLPRWFLFIR
jgi:hypothetical protein